MGDQTVFDDEEEIIKYPLCQSWARIINWFMFIVHFVLLIVFGVYEIIPMAAVNIASLVIYIGLLPRLQNRPKLYMSVLYFEIFTHMILAIYYSGWYCGFQMYAFFLIPFAFYADYVLLEDEAPTVNPLVVSFISMITYIGSWFFFEYCKMAQDQMPYRHGSVIFALNAISLMGTMIFITYVFLERILDNARKMTRTAEYDELTGLANRHQIDKLLKMHDIGGATGENQYGVAILDIDNFKKVNDQFGHLAGDRVLYDIAVILRSVESRGIYVFRWGGEEFMILTLEKDSTDNLREVCERVRKTLYNRPGNSPPTQIFQRLI